MFFYNFAIVTKVGCSRRTIFIVKVDKLNSTKLTFHITQVQYMQLLRKQFGNKSVKALNQMSYFNSTRRNVIKMFGKSYYHCNRFHKQMFLFNICNKERIYELLNQISVLFSNFPYPQEQKLNMTKQVYDDFCRGFSNK